jgi:hypothetical protein
MQLYSLSTDNICFVLENNTQTQNTSNYEKLKEFINIKLTINSYYAKVSLKS